MPTGRCLIVVTPDAQRTMNTFLGVSSLLGPDDVSTEVAASGQVVYMEGYLYDRPEAKMAYRKAAEVAHRARRKVSLTLSDSFCVDRHRGTSWPSSGTRSTCSSRTTTSWRPLYEVDDLDEAVRQVRRDCDIAAVTVGADGSLVVTADDVIAVKAEPVARVVDTTGAGDLYAAGFLFGYTSGADLAECGRLGSVAAAEVISHVGARPSGAAAPARLRFDLVALGTIAHHGPSAPASRPRARRRRGRRPRRLRQRPPEGGDRRPGTGGSDSGGSGGEPSGTGSGGGSGGLARCGEILRAYGSLAATAIQGEDAAANAKETLEGSPTSCPRTCRTT